MEINKFIEDFRSQLENENTPISADTDYVNSDFWDSLTSMVIKVMIEDDYQLDIPVEKINTFSTVGDLFTYIKEQK
jgi:acyl carrier protein